MLQLDTLWGRKRTGSVRSLQTSRPHSDADFSELDEQVELIEALDEDALNERFEKMLVSIDYVIFRSIITRQINETIICSE